jgi:hypothetical protein
MTVIARRMSAQIDGEFVVFLIGARINKWWKLGQFKWVGDAMNAMIAELQQQPDSGFLGHESWLGRTTMMVQYWRSMEQLMAYARQRDAVHFPTWVRFNKEIASNGNIGIWHETYLVKPGNYECVYNNMPAFGLARVATAVPAEGSRHTARGRLGETSGDDAPIAVDGTER